MPACLQDVEEAHDVALDVGARVLDGVAHARLRREVHDDVELMLREQALNEHGVAEISADEGEATVSVDIPQHLEA